MNARINNILNPIFKVLIAAALVFICYVASSTLLSPAPFKTKLIAPKQEISVCKGSTFEYVAEVEVVRAPTTLVVTESWFSYDSRNTVVWSTFADAKVFNWDTAVVGKIFRKRPILVPEKTTSINGKSRELEPGKYRFIVNYNPFSTSSSIFSAKTSSLSVVVNVQDCS